MKFLLLGKGKSITSIKKYLKAKKCEYVQAVFEYEYEKKYLLADETLFELENIDYAIKSPGISETNRLYQKLQQKFTFICELDLLYLFFEKIKVIAITGSNGKTTGVRMLTYLLKKEGKKVLCCGNSHQPITHFFKEFDKLDYLIVELSSFQLHDLRFYAPFIATIFNLHANHLDHVYSLKSYFEAKKKIYSHMNHQHYFILNRPVDEQIKIQCNGNVMDQLLYPSIKELKESIRIYKTQIDFCYTVFKILNLPTDMLLTLNDFKTLPYREEKHYFKNLCIINDSKSTSVDATLFALSHIKCKENAILILGGKDKQLSFKRLEQYPLYCIICYGEIALKVQFQLKNVLLVKNLKEAFQVAMLLSVKPKTILFSPAASSFDSFSSFEDRGKYFNRLILRYGCDNE